MHPETPSDPTRRYLAYNGEQLAYTDEGAGDVVLAIHGLPGSVRDFRWIAPAMPDVRFIRVELPGYGESTRTEFSPMDIGARADVVRHLLDTLKLDVVSLMTHSAGGVVGAELAARSPDRVAAVALLACPGPRAHPAVRFTRRFASVLESRVGRTLATPLQRGFYRIAGFSSSLTDDVRTFTTLDAAGQEFGRHRRNLEQMTQPTLTAWAVDDRMIPERLFTALEEVAPAGPRMRFERGGHNIQKTQATEIAAEFGRLLRA